ncbi:hypothetical protein [Salibacter halophilus]|uniref:Uncharacterized protein n=1 Tax=Salibacter halophilus TaxID=1803916 RepID=A0A6N6M7L4_9FLAO|nr:hypothetical protein [Salibacter halophilus]KAB1066068.1 hypothetical protein F3059_00955 [Salibacter halophilus]
MQRKFIKNVGFEFTYEKVSLILQLITVTKENHNLSEEQLKGLIQATSDYLSRIDNKTNLLELFGEVELKEEQIKVNDFTFYKFISKDTYENFIRKGKFQLGSLKYYREIERDKSRDEKEGFCNLIFENHNQQVFTSAISGFNFYILCGTHKLDEKHHMTENFGDYILKIKSISSFANSIKKAIGAKEWKIQKVYYTDFKAHKIKTNLKDFEGANPELSAEIFKLIQKHSVFPSIFMKPKIFKPENELRLTFKMDKNVKPKLNFDNKGLLEYIEIENYGQQWV